APRAHGGRLRARPTRRGNRVPQAPGLVRQGPARFRGPAATVARGKLVRRSRGDLRVLPAPAGRRQTARRGRAGTGSQGFRRLTMMPDHILALLREVATGGISPEAAMRRL